MTSHGIAEQTIGVRDLCMGEYYALLWSFCHCRIFCLYISAQYAPCIAMPIGYYSSSLPAFGYWTAGQRLNPNVCVSATSKTEFVWRPNGLPVSSINPLVGWPSTNPDCYDGYFSSNLHVEGCVGIKYTLPNKIIDVPCGMPRCPICELEMWRIIIWMRAIAIDHSYLFYRAYSYWTAR